MYLAPIALFTYKRVETLRKVIHSLKSNSLASNSKLFIYSDGYKNSLDFEQVKKVREYIYSLKGFLDINIITK